MDPSHPIIARVVVASSPSSKNIRYIGPSAEYNLPGQNSVSDLCFGAGLGNGLGMHGGRRNRVQIQPTVEIKRERYD